MIDFFMLGNKMAVIDNESAFAELVKGDVVKVTPIGAPAFLAFYSGYEPRSTKWAYFKSLYDTAARALPPECIEKLEVLVLEIDTCTLRKSVTVPAKPASKPAPEPKLYPTNRYGWPTGN